MVCVACLLILSTPGEVSLRLSAGASGQTTPTSPTYPNTSWALGIVVPQGAPLAGGGRLRWEDVENVTAVFTLPNITMPDGVIYAVLSVMTDTNGVIQAAVGVRPNGAAWFAYSWSVPDVGAVPLVYHWVLNGTEPKMPPGSDAVVTIFRSLGSWNVKITNADKGTSMTHEIPDGQGSSIEAGDQELFSLESYTRSTGTFSGMGNLTLRYVLVDGTEVSGGTYAYSEWDPNHSPLFVVGSSGSSPPSFISLGQAKSGSFVWGYGEVWKNSDAPLLVASTLALTLIPVLLGIGLILWKAKHARKQVSEFENRVYR